MAVERVERHGSLSRAGLRLGSEVILSKDNTEELDIPFDQPSAGTKQEAEKPYSIYTSSEKWFIVSVASLAALFR